MLLPLLPKCWEYRSRIPLLVYAVLGIELRVSCMPQAFYQLRQIPSPISDVVVVLQCGMFVCGYVCLCTHMYQGLNTRLLHMLNMHSTIRAIHPEIFLVLHYDAILNVNTM